MADKRKRSLIAGVMLVVCIGILIATFGSRCSRASEDLKAHETLAWYPVPLGSDEYSQDTVPSIYAVIGHRSLDDYRTEAGAGEQYWTVYSYLSPTPAEDMETYAAKLTGDEGFVLSDGYSGATWLEREYANGMTTVVTIYGNSSGYELWVGSQQGRRE